MHMPMKACALSWTSAGASSGRSMATHQSFMVSACLTRICHLRKSSAPLSLGTPKESELNAMVEEEQRGWVKNDRDEGNKGLDVVRRAGRSCRRCLGAQERWMGPRCTEEGQEWARDNSGVRRALHVKLGRRMRVRVVHELATKLCERQRGREVMAQLLKHARGHNLRKNGGEQ